MGLACGVRVIPGYAPVDLHSLAASGAIGAGTLLGALALSAGGDALAVLGAASGLGFGLVCLRICARRTSGFGVRVCRSDLPQGEVS